MRRAGVGVDAVRSIFVVRRRDGIGDETPASGATSLRRVAAALARILAMVDAATGSRTDRRRRRRRRSRRWSLRLPVLDRRRPNGSSEGHRPRPASCRREVDVGGGVAERWMDTPWTAMSESNDVASATSAVSGAAISVATEAGHLPNTAIVGSRTDAEAGRFLVELVIPRMRFSRVIGRTPDLRPD